MVISPKHVKASLGALLVITSLFVGIFIAHPPKASAAALCYREEAPLLTSKVSCPPSGGTVVYKDAAGNTIATPTDGCYLYQPNPGTSFNIYTQFSGACSSLEATTAAYRQKQCTDTNGQWKPATPMPGDNTAESDTCVCPLGTSLRSTGRCEGSTNNVGSGQAETGPQPVAIVNDCDASDGQVNENNCGIIRYLVLLINTLAALTGLVIVGSIIYGGIQYASAGSDPQKISAAKDRIRNALIALMFFIFGYSFLNYLVPGGVL